MNDLTNLLDNFNDSENETKTEWENLKFEEVEEHTYTAKQWNPVPNESITGKYLGATEGKGKGEGLTFHNLIDTEGNEISILGATVLDNKLRTIEKGTVIRIVYEGYCTSERGREYKSYKVLIGRDN